MSPALRPSSSRAPGLTGLALHRLGVPFRILEAVSDLRPLGVGINLQPHAVRELFELGLEGALDATGLRTEEVVYFSAPGRLIWRKLRGILAGYRWPQYSIHRGRRQMLLLDALRRRAGEVVRTAAAVTGRSEAVYEYPMVDHGPLARWTRGRVTLIGAAAHAMYPIGSNGASQGIVDAVVLAREIRLSIDAERILCRSWSAPLGPDGITRRIGQGPGGGSPRSARG